MLERRPLGTTGMEVSVLGLGTVKFGRNAGVKYPQAFELPDDRRILALLDAARACGINVLDTAPAYGTSETRLGALLADRDRWVVVTKAGEDWDNGVSRFDFSAAHLRLSVERSLKRLRTDRLDVVLLHSNGDDRAALEDGLEPLLRMKAEGKVRAVGLSGKTPDDAKTALDACDVLMCTANLAYRAEEAVIAEAGRRGVGVLVKKALESGHAGDPAVTLRHVAALPGVGSIVVGTLDPDHLRANARALSS